MQALGVARSLCGEVSEACRALSPPLQEELEPLAEFADTICSCLLSEVQPDGLSRVGYASIGETLKL